jgi:hypothetical protein
MPSFEEKIEQILGSKDDNADTNATSKVATMMSHFKGILKTIVTDGINFKTTNKIYDSINIFYRGGVQTAIAAGTNATTTSGELTYKIGGGDYDEVTFNAILVHVYITGTGSWKIDHQNVPVSGRAGINSYDGSVQHTTGNINASGSYLFKGISKFGKIVANEVADGSIVEVLVEPINI